MAKLLELLIARVNQNRKGQYIRSIEMGDGEVELVQISSSLALVVGYSSTHTLYVYSINGKYLSHVDCGEKLYGIRSCPTTFSHVSLIHALISNSPKMVTSLLVEGAKGL